MLTRVLALLVSSDQQLPATLLAELWQPQCILLAAHVCRVLRGSTSLGQHSQHLKVQVQQQGGQQLVVFMFVTPLWKEERMLHGAPT